MDPSSIALTLAAGRVEKRPRFDKVPFVAIDARMLLTLIDTLFAREESMAPSLVLLAGLALLGALPGRAGSSLSVHVSGFRNGKGMLQCSLFAGDGGFPDHPESAVATQRAPIRADHTALCQFAGLAPGEYAVGVMHDENGNGKMDFNLVGMPTEGYGMSNNHLHALRAPDWAESKFRVDAGADMSLMVNLRY